MASPADPVRALSARLRADLYGEPGGARDAGLLRSLAGGRTMTFRGASTGPCASPMTPTAWR